MEAHNVVKTQSGKRIVGYEDIAEAALGKFGRAIVSGMVYVELSGTCALLFILQVSRRRHSRPALRSTGWCPGICMVRLTGGARIPVRARETT